MQKSFEIWSKASNDKALELLNVVNSTNSFSANGWSYEVAFKYLFKANSKYIEVGYYIHYVDDSMDKPFKWVIELPTSYGCPMKCAFCASSCVSTTSLLNVIDLCSVTEILMKIHGLADRDVLITFTGTGDLYYTLDSVSEFIFIMSRKYCNLKFTVSSCNWTDKTLKTIEELSTKYMIRNIQATFISTDEDVVKRLIPGLKYIEYTPLAFFNHIKTSSLNNWRVNYLLIQAINDDSCHINDFVNIIKPIRERVVVRLSSLNETIASKSFGLFPVTFQCANSLKKMFTDSGINAYIFQSEHNDNMSCGQLILEGTIASEIKSQTKYRKQM